MKQDIGSMATRSRWYADERSFAAVAGVVLCFGLLAGCTAAVDKGSVRASSGVPESERVDPVHVAYDRTLPTFVVMVRPFEVGAGGQPSASVPPPQDYHYRGGGPVMLLPWLWHQAHDPAPQAAAPSPQGLSDRIATGLAAQFETALGNVGNVALVSRDRRGVPSLREGEVGPFQVEGTVTEFNEVAEADSSRRGFSFGSIGSILGIAGGLSGSRVAGLTGAGIAAADPTYDNTKLRRTGSVTLDIRVVDPDGRILGSFSSSGTFTAESASSGFALLGFHQGEAAFAQSALGQATRVALNDAVMKVVPVLSRAADQRPPSRKSRGTHRRKPRERKTEDERTE